MSANKEVLTKTVTRRIPPLGTPEYFIYLRDFQPSDEHLSNPKQFMDETMVATSLALMIRRNRTYWPLGNQYTADMDSRLFYKKPLGRPELFTGSVGVRTNQPTPNHLRLHAQHLGRSYDLDIPVTDTYHYDPSGYVYASYQYSESKPQIYNEMAASEYDEHNTEILFKTLRDAADDSLDVLHHIHGHITETQYPEVPVFWHSDFINDDPNELMPRASRIQRALQRLHRINTPWRPSYLKDDPNEFLKPV